MIIKNSVSLNSNIFTYRDMLSRVRFLVTEIALQADKLVNDLFVRESINRAIVDVYERLYDKIKYHYLATAQVDVDEPVTDYVPIIPVSYKYNSTEPFKYGRLTLGEPNLSNYINEILTMNILGLSIIQRSDMDTFENISNNFNTVFRQSSMYVSYVEYFELYIGDKLWERYVDEKPKIRMSYIRKPLLDDLKKVHPDVDYAHDDPATELSYFSENHNHAMDIPSEYNRLIEALVMKDIYNSLGQPLPDNYDNIITTIIQQMIGVANVESNNSIPARDGE